MAALYFVLNFSQLHLHPCDIILLTRIQQNHNTMYNIFIPELLNDVIHIRHYELTSAELVSMGPKMEGSARICQECHVTGVMLVL